MAMINSSRTWHVLPLLATSVLSIGFLSGLSSSGRAVAWASQDPLYPSQDPGEQDAGAMPEQDQQPVGGDEGDTPRRGRRARSKAATPKKARLATGKNAGSTDDAKPAARREQPRPRPRRLPASVSRTISHRSWLPIASAATARAVPDWSGENST